MRHKRFEIMNSLKLRLFRVLLLNIKMLVR